ncbi:hypothetical protein NP493_283g06011 [Ridgeia piscesae]|uniref:Uncharacterized protein n=1 Tax=Ridgeia piscesae TaxID=27915 RepID=A0AAD9NX52_RIDPI|nr:hypothetical protein NP493_283g06011 [Ridgeia piscesae]
MYMSPCSAVDILRVGTVHTHKVCSSCSQSVYTSSVFISCCVQHCAHITHQIKLKSLFICIMHVSVKLKVCYIDCVCLCVKLKSIFYVLCMQVWYLKFVYICEI